MADDSKVCTGCGRTYGDEAVFCPKDGSALVPNVGLRRDADSFLGREILGHIEIKSLVGSGAMGRVYRAHQKGVDRDVAVKILHKDLASNPDIVQRFLREAKVASKLNHPNVVQVLLAGQLDDGTLYLVMEYLDGISVQSALLAAGGMLPLERAMHIGIQACEAIGQAHEHGVVHRDVKPENIMLVKRGDDSDFVKVLDFGIARISAPGSGTETQAGLVFGTARYLSPEGAKGEPVSSPSDCYALATVLYQCLAGRTPFENDSSVSLLVAQIHDPPPPLRSRANVPAAIEAVIMKNLVKDPAQRDPDGHTFARNLLEAAVAAGLSADDLVARPTFARKSKMPPASTPGVPASALTPEPPITSSGRIVPKTQAVMAPPELAMTTPAVSQPAASSQPPGRRVARTLDDEDSLPPPQPTNDSVQGTSSPTPPEESLETVPGVPRRGRMVAIIAVCALLGIGGLGVGAYRLGWVGKKVEAKSELDQLLDRARAALKARHFDEPPGDNVLELTDKALKLAPDEPRVFAVRNSAADKLVREALERQAKEDQVGALALLKLADKFAPNDKGILDEIAEVEATLAKDPKTAGLVTDGGAGKYAATLTVGDEVVQPSQPVTLVAKVTGDPKEADKKAHFTITGPGLEKGKQIEARAESPDRYLASFVFPQTGTFKIVFVAKPDGFPLTVTAERVVGGKPAVPVPSLTVGPKPSTSTTGSWPKPPTSGTATGTGTSVVLTPDPTPIPMPTIPTVPVPPMPTP
ncbi:MAG: protein kinase [Myxococcales bacterium]|nr:protein kinase [Myxococcales bacterium]